MEFADSWLWLIFVAAGLLLAIMELLVGVDTGMDMVIIGSAFVLGGLITWPFQSWIATAIVVSIIAILYVAFGRKYIHQRLQIKDERTNVDSIIGKTGMVLREISENDNGIVKIDHEEWRARAVENIPEGNEVVVIKISGVTLTVKKQEGGI